MNEVCRDCPNQTEQIKTGRNRSGTQRFIVSGLRENLYARSKETRLLARGARKGGQNVCRGK